MNFVNSVNFVNLVNFVNFVCFVSFVFTKGHAQTAGEIEVMVKSSSFIGGTRAVPGLS